jgi:PIN domain nuclease of toxin-antitoxin system
MRNKIWAAGTLPYKAAALATAANSRLFFSPASLWEISIKNGLGRSDFKIDPEALWRGLMDNHYFIGSS